jgi:hypothetical protein
MKSTSLISLMLTAILFSSCFHKNVMKDHADDVITVLEYRQDNKDYIITTESIFQANSKSSGGGITTISGYNDIRLSVYELETGKLVIREKIGKILEGKNTVLLGCTPGNLWLYSEKEDLGLYSIDPLTLKIKRTQDQLLNAYPDLKGNLAAPEYYTVLNFYSFDPIEQKPVITDTRGYRYAIDPVSLKASKIDGETGIFGSKSYDYFSTSVKVGDTYMSLNGELRKKIQFAGKECNELDFLDGKFIISQNFGTMFQRFTDEMKQDQNVFDSLSLIIDSIEQQFGTQNWYYPKEISVRYGKMKSEKDELQRSMEEFDRVFKSVRSSDYDGCLLQSDPNCFYIVHKNTTNKDAFMCISKVCKPSGAESETVFTEAWETVLPNVFFDTSAAEQTDAFKEVFSKGNPEFDFAFFDIIGDKLILIYALNMVCIDINTGKIRWQYMI